MKTTSRLLAALTCLSLVAGVAGAAAAGTATATFPVTATVAANCTISASGLSFGAYDPLVANASTALTATNTITLACVKGIAPTIGLDVGQHGPQASGTTRAMSGAGAFLSYELYKDAAHANVWGSSGSGLDTLSATTNTNPFGVTVYGVIPAGQTGAANGAYSDTITATVNF